MRQYYKTHEEILFLKQIITGDEKYMVYDKVAQIRIWCHASNSPQCTPKVNIHPRKVMLCIWWNIL